MDFFNSAVTTMSTLVTALGGGLGVWGVINLMEGYGGDKPSAKRQERKRKSQDARQRLSESKQ